MNHASYSGTKKVNAQFTLKAICLNLLKATNKIFPKPSRWEQSVRSAPDEANAVRNPFKSGSRYEKQVVLHQ